MQNLTELLKSKRLNLKTLSKNGGGRKINIIWEEAKEFCHYLDLEPKNIPFLLRCFKKYGREDVLLLKSWLKDANVEKKNIAGLIIWKLKENEKAKRLKNSTKTS